MNDKPIDELVAEKVMGWIKPPETSILKAMWVETPVGAVHPQLPKFSTNIKDAWLVIDALYEKENIRMFVSNNFHPLWEARCKKDNGDWIGHGVDNYSAPMAICIAALKAVGEEWQ
ncbi:BC1872 family protein [Bacillus cereus]|uniref:BC1872 family protein n=1 Tax=Bacillus cereus TaxID=1396 RepID=UPI001E3808D2|nr:hypothetical protein [Bacillus cereus]MCC2453300.1 hypothetical protein [Bacillus cereus]